MPQGSVPTAASGNLSNGQDRLVLLLRCANFSQVLQLRTARPSSAFGECSILAFLLVAQTLRHLCQGAGASYAGLSDNADIHADVVGFAACLASGDLVVPDVPSGLVGQRPQAP